MKLILLTILSLIFSFNTSGQTWENKNLVFDASDLRIIIKADSILSDPTKWNKNDDRECADDITRGKYSLYCALYKASIDVTGVYIHRRAAMQIVRFTIEKYDKGNTREHRLMDWNNDPETTFAALKKVLKESIETVKKQLP